MEYKYTAIILNKRNVGETDRICTMYSLEGGKIKSVAKGVRKPQAKLAASLESITLADVTIVRSRGLGKITGSIVENNFTAIKKDEQALLNVFAVFHLFDKLVDFENPDQGVFELLQKYLESMEKAVGGGDEQKYLIFRYGFIVKLLDALGYAIGVDTCVSCGAELTPVRIGFSSQQGGVLCENCIGQDKDAILVSVNAVKMLRLFLKNDLPTFAKIQASRQDFDSMRLAVDDFLRWNL